MGNVIISAVPRLWELYCRCLVAQYRPLADDLIGRILYGMPFFDYRLEMCWVQVGEFVEIADVLSSV